MVYHDRLETSLLQQFAHPETSEWFSIIYVISFEVNIVAEQKQSILGNDFLFFVSLHCPQLFYGPLCPSAVPVTLKPNARVNNMFGCYLWLRLSY